jgi:hypothetical protein
MRSPGEVLRSKPSKEHAKPTESVSTPRAEIIQQLFVESLLRALESNHIATINTKSFHT